MAEPLSWHVGQDLWLEAMRRGDFAAAWGIGDRLIEARAGATPWHLPRHRQWVWDGSPVAGRRLLVRCYHGLGDTIQFVRFAAPLRQRAREVVLWAPAKLLPLLRTASGIDRLLPLQDGEPEVERDVDLEIMELPHALRTTLETLPAAVPYLRAEPARLPRGGGLQVGIAWRSGVWDPQRNLRLRQVAPLAGVPGVRWHVLQEGPAAWAVGGAAGPGDRPSRGPFGPLAGPATVTALARLVRALDLVITVDSLFAHLAGALAVPTWTLLRADCDWRWLRGRADSPWYPTMRLFRQERAGDWEPVVARVGQELARRVAGLL